MSNHIIVECNCHQRFRVKLSQAGKRAQCPKCQTDFVFPGQDELARMVGRVVNLRQLADPSLLDDPVGDLPWVQGDVIESDHALYQVLEVARGSMAAVARVRKSSKHSQVGADARTADVKLSYVGDNFCLKTPHSDVRATSSASQRMMLELFMQEAENWVRLGQHPNIAQALSVFRDRDGRAYVETPWLTGGSLAELVQQQGGLPVEQGVEMALGIARGMEYAHSKGLIHRDLKPQNVMVAADGVPKITDFGLVKFIVDDVAGSAEGGEHLKGRSVGTPSYMAPEQFEDSTEVGQGADTYAFGSMLYLLFAGTRPYSCTVPRGTDADGLLALWKKVHQDTPIPTEVEGRTDLPPLIIDLIGRCLEKDPQQRVKSFTPIHQTLESLHEELGGQPTRRDDVRVSDELPVDQGSDFAGLAVTQFRGGNRSGCARACLGAVRADDVQQRAALVPLLDEIRAGGSKEVILQEIVGLSKNMPEPADRLAATRLAAALDEGRYHVRPDGVVWDRVTGLYWQREGPAKLMDWNVGRKFCKNLTLAGVARWDLPTAEQLKTLLESPAGDIDNDTSLIDSQAFPDTVKRPVRMYWTRSKGHAGASVVDFNRGLMESMRLDAEGHVRAVATLRNEETLPEPTLLGRFGALKAKLKGG